MLNQANLVQEMSHLRKFAMRLTHSQAEADDLLQATMLRAIEKKHLFENDTDVFKWTSKIMFNLFVSDYRRRTKFETRYDPETFIERESIEASSETKVELAEVQEAIQSLSDDHRDVLVMVCVKGMQYQEVAEMLEIPLGTVRSRLSRAREQLQDLLDTPHVRHFVPPMSGMYDGGYAQAA